tara:strand:+ start:138 stop:605 length:468 start_codon:yes stop_codon:yes gene_type:complete
MSKIKSFRGLIASGTQDTVVLHTNDGSVGYKIKKFQIMPHVPGDNNDQELICMIWKIQQPTSALSDNTTTRPDFSNNTLLACAFAINDTDNHLNYNETTVFDNEIFNQDIYITFRDIGGATQSCNYYIELEQFKLDLNDNTMATLKDIRNETLAI